MIRAFLLVFSAVSASVPKEEAHLVSAYSSASIVQQNRADSLQSPGATDSAGRGGQRDGGGSKSDGPVRTDVEASPGAVGGGVSSWLRIFGFLLLVLAALSAIVAI